MSRGRLLHLAVLLPILGLGGQRAAAAAPGPLRVTLAFTGDVGGYLEPCG